MRSLLVPQRRRDIERPFGWIPLRLLSAPAWLALSPAAKLLYCVLSVVSDRRGLSYYGDRRLAQLAGLSQPALVDARTELEHGDLLAVDAASNLVQLLSLPREAQNAPHNATEPAEPQQPRPAAAAARSGPPRTHDSAPSPHPDIASIRQLIATLSKKMAR